MKKVLHATFLLKFWVVAVLYISPVWSIDEVCFLQFILQQERKLKIEVLRISLL